jgi:hypothetical protein
MVLAVGGVVVGIALVLGLFVWAIPSLTESETIEVNLGEDEFDAGSAEARSASIAEDGPLLFSDVASGERDIFVQHIGDDPAEGWAAFDARRPGQPRECSLRWEPDPGRFVDPCDGTVVPADGEGLLSYPVEVTEDGELIIDLTPDEQSPDTSSP